jgi:hypothetical protein
VPHTLRSGAVGAVLIGILCTAAAAAAPGAAPVEHGAWKHHHSTFSYYGLTSLYTCDGLEDKVKEILLYLGARSDALVQATGCSPGPNSPSHTAFVTVDFNTVQATPDSADADGMQAQWADRQVAARHPRFIDAGDCELIDGLRTVLKDGFSWRGLDYSTTCVPYDLSLGGFNVRGEVLQPSAPPPAH